MGEAVRNSAWASNQRIIMTQTRRLAATSVAIAGWVTACVAIAGIVSLWYAVKLGFAPEPVRTPAEWVVGRAFLFGAPFAIAPIALYVWLARTSQSAEDTASVTASFDR
jgi:hypothetical protein